MNTLKAAVDWPIFNSNSYNNSNNNNNNNNNTVFKILAGWPVIK
jgi:hypothetical protein